MAADRVRPPRRESPGPAADRHRHRSAAGQGAVWRLLRSLVRRTGIQVKLSPHVLRATYVTLSRDAGVPLEDIQDGAGHADVRTTRRYDRAAVRLDRSPGYALAAYLSD